MAKKLYALDVMIRLGVDRKKVALYMKRYGRSPSGKYHLSVDERQFEHLEAIGVNDLWRKRGVPPEEPGFREKLAELDGKHWDWEVPDGH